MEQFLPINSSKPFSSILILLSICGLGVVACQNTAVSSEEAIQSKDSTILQSSAILTSSESITDTTSATTDTLAQAAPDSMAVPKPVNKTTTPPKKKKKRPQLSFDDPDFDFGKIMEGEIIEHTFHFKNTGKADLEIQDVKVSCGCTVPSFPFLPIAPGESSIIEITFNSKGKLGKQRPAITVYSNARPRKQSLQLTGIVDTPRAD